ncbi:MAG: alkyl hydroperoxide reductase subunit F [Burkholderiaceae bacterium]|jgi:alkyl hydroperoxide reductase subunit F|nr:alkyl hydroperoxide reductase subunit F [Burkholderiaceae bacterium]
MLEKEILDQVGALLRKLQRPVEITVLTDDSVSQSREMEEMLGEIEALSPLVSVTKPADGEGRRPSFSLTTPGQDMGITFAGLPMGHEFTSFALALLHAGGHPPRIDSELRAQVEALQGPLHFESYVSLSCTNCPEVVQSLNLMATLNPRISHTMVDGTLFLKEVENKVMSVPTVFLNGEQLVTGRVGIREILALVDTESVEREAAEMSEKPPFDVLVVGGGAAGSTAAIYASRKGIRTGLVTKNVGGQVLSTTVIENMIILKEVQGIELAATLEENVRASGVDVMTIQEIVSLEEREDGLFELQTQSGAILKSRTVILSPGANWSRLNVRGESIYIGRGVAFCAHCDGPLYKGKRVAVVGGGNGAAEAALDLAGITEHVTLLVRGDKMEADAILQEKVAAHPGIRVVLRASVLEILGDDNSVNTLVYRDQVHADRQLLDVDGIFVQIGLQPATEWLRGTLAMTLRGEIEVDDHGRTSLSGVFAAGDATTVPYKQLVTAMGSGATAALSAFDYLIRS